MDTVHTMPNTLEELRALERDVERQWWWLHGALNAVAQAAHPNITWIGWGIVWAIVLVVLVWPRRLG
jgi:DNA-binding IclR family transcriptional regulator